MMGYQFGKWRMGRHARAFATLATDKAYEIAKEKGIKGSPQTNEACLKCHTSACFDPAGGRQDSYWVYEGVGCEACHGAGSGYAEQARMLDVRAAKAAGLKDVTEQTCLRCHEDAHDKPFDYEEAVAKIAHPTRIEQVAETPRYKTPLNLALTPDGRELYVACEASHTVVVVDVETQRKTAEIEVGRHPTDVTFSPD